MASLFMLYHFFLISFGLLAVAEIINKQLNRYQFDIRYEGAHAVFDKKPSNNACQ